MPKITSIISNIAYILNRSHHVLQDLTTYDDHTQYLNNTRHDIQERHPLNVIGNVNGVAGDIMYFNGTDWVRLPAGSANNSLTYDATNNAPKWSNPVSLSVLAVQSAAAAEPVTVSFNAPSNMLIVDALVTSTVAVSSRQVRFSFNGSSAGQWNYVDHASGATVGTTYPVVCGVMGNSTVGATAHLHIEYNVLSGYGTSRLYDYSNNLSYYGSFTINGTIDSITIDNNSSSSNISDIIVIGA